MYSENDTEIYITRCVNFTSADVDIDESTPNTEYIWAEFQNIGKTLFQV